jgi:hypothetical protein
MKKCSYCGQEYPDTATVCATDDEQQAWATTGEDNQV